VETERQRDEFHRTADT